MDASKLELPLGVPLARYVDDMREVVAFDVLRGLYIGRWDTCIGDTKMHVMRDLPTWAASFPSEELIEEERGKAKQYFSDHEHVHAI